MKSLSTIINLYTTLSQNLTSANQTLGLQLEGDTHRYLLQKYFDNEREFQTTTVGAMTLATTAAIAGGATTATLTATWLYPTGQQNVTFKNLGGTTATTTVLLANAAVSATLSVAWTGPTGFQNVTFVNTNSDVRDVQFTNNSTAITWTVPLASATTSKTLTTNATSEIHKVLFENGSTSLNWSTPLTYGITDQSIATQGFQDYIIPAQISKITSTFIQVGQLRFVPVPILTRVDWDRVNFLPYTSDIVNYAYIYNGQMKFWPIPSTTGDMIQFNYKSRVPDFSTAFLFSDAVGTAYVAGATTFDFQKGTITPPAVGAITVTGSGTGWNTNGKFPLNVDITFFNLFFRIDPPNGDGIWYPIYQFASDTSLTLAIPMQSQMSSAGGATYTIAMMPVLTEDFHDMIVHGPLMTYFASIVENEAKFKQFDSLYKTRLTLLEDYAGTKQISADLESEPVLSNPNSYPYAQP